MTRAKHLGQMPANLEASLSHMKTTLAVMVSTGKARKMASKAMDSVERPVHRLPTSLDRFTANVYRIETCHTIRHWLSQATYHAGMW